MLDELRLGLGGEQPVPKLGLAEDQLQAVTAAEHQELERRERTCRDQRPPPEPTGKVVIVVDNCLAFSSEPPSWMVLMWTKASLPDSGWMKP
jgi:hypothetical protein